MPGIFVDGLIMIHGHFGPQELTKLSKNSNNYLQTSSWGDRQMITVGPAMFINHSCEKNVEFEMSTRKSVKVKVLKPIRPGEELVESYPHLVKKENCLCETCRN